MMCATVVAGCATLVGLLKLIVTFVCLDSTFVDLIPTFVAPEKSETAVISLAFIFCNTLHD